MHLFHGCPASSAHHGMAMALGMVALFTLMDVFSKHPSRFHSIGLIL